MSNVKPDKTFEQRRDEAAKRYVAWDALAEYSDKESAEGEK